MQSPKDWREYDSIRKIILKNISIDYSKLDKEAKSVVSVYPTKEIPNLIRTINMNPEVVEALEQYFRGKFNEEKETEANTAANNLES